MNPELAAIVAVGFLVPIASGLWLPQPLLRWFEPLWTVCPPIALTYHYLGIGRGVEYASAEALIFPLMVMMFVLIWPWIIWSRIVFRLLQQRRATGAADPRCLSR